jgi:hypothetical protein
MVTLDVDIIGKGNIVGVKRRIRKRFNFMMMEKKDPFPA